MRGMGQRRLDGGFTVMEILVALIVLMIGMLGIMSMLSSTVKGNRVSRRLERAKGYAVQTMEELRANTAIVPSGAVVTLPDISSPEGLAYQRQYRATAVPGQVSLYLLEVEASWLEDGDTADRRSARVQMLRTVQELL